MKTDTRQKAINFIKEKQRVRPHDLFLYLDISHVAVHKILKKLVTDGLVTKTGKPPYVYYELTSQKPALTIGSKIPENIALFIENNFLYISPTGVSHYGVDGFRQWVAKINQENSFTRLADEYFQQSKNINNKYKKNELINATYKLRQTFRDNLAIDDLYFLDFYSLPKFGKTKVGQLVLFAKQSQNLPLIKKLVELSRNQIIGLINQKKINAVCFIPHTIPRKVQFLKEYERLIDLKLPKIVLIKVYKDNLFVPQKSLTSLEDRIINARDTIFIKESLGQFNNILLIDDAVGSGASMNETAKKFKNQIGESCNIVGFALVGSYKGFDVIKEI